MEPRDHQLQVEESSCCRCVQGKKYLGSFPEKPANSPSYAPPERTTRLAPNTKLFVLVRKDLPNSVRIVQAIHAAVNLIASHPPSPKDWGRYGPNLVLYGVSKEAELAFYLQLLGTMAKPFYEPDLGDALTAIAYLGVDDSPFNNLQLL